MKTITEIKRLLYLFYEGKATITQENELKEYFSQTYIAQELLDEQAIFNAMFPAENSEINIPDTLKQKLIETIDNLESKNKPKTIKNRIIPYYVAAFLVLFFCLSILWLQQKPEIQYITQREQQDLVKAQQAIMLLSEKYNKGLEELNQTQQKLSKTNEILQKSLNQVTY